jgi:thiamine biosynthesis lipoprotein
MNARVPVTSMRQPAGTNAVFRRARPWLGTLVEMQIEGLDAAAAARACERAFAEVAAVHALMSFHEGAGDLARLHGTPPGVTVRVDARTREVLECALRIAAASAGAFDPTIAARLVESGMLPRPLSPWTPDPSARWSDIELPGARGVRLARPQWIDLGGIAKGYAVDRAIEILVDAGAVQACVNAGGDLRVAGERVGRVNLRTHAGVEAWSGVEVADGAVATSAGTGGNAPARSRVHLDGRTRRPAGTRLVATVVAARCIVADALTKVVLAGPAARAARVLAQFGAQACVHDPRRGWSPLRVAA